jgi:predicted HTH transcriptional regulator
MNQENQNIEWKESWRDEYLKWICGFANAQGGKIYIGKTDKGEIIDLKDAAKWLEDIPNKVRDILGILVNVNLLSEQNRLSQKSCDFAVSSESRKIHHGCFYQNWLFQNRCGFSFSRLSGV